MLKRTKIVATLGPACNSADQLSALVSAGVDVVRLNFSHGKPEEHKQRAHLIRSIAAQQNKHVAILGDLQGPKIRISQFKDKQVILNQGEDFTLDAGMDATQGTNKKVGITYENLIRDCKPGDVLLLDDGRITMEVKSKEQSRLHCIVLQGGTLSDNKGINLKGGGLSASALTEKDKEDIKLAVQIGVDYLAISFVRSVDDINLCRQLLKDASKEINILTKIERAEVVASQEKLEAIIKASDAVMVARGDLGVEIGDAELVTVQKNTIATARRLNKPVITATQMMESMIYNALPTRAEVFDVANAILDGTDAVMLSAETATGNCPHGVVSEMHRIISSTEKQMREVPTLTIPHLPEVLLTANDETIAVAAMYAANHLKDVKAIVCLTKTGQTALWMSRINSFLPVFAFSRFEQTCRHMTLYRGVYSLKWDVSPDTDEKTREKVISDYLTSAGFKKNDKIILTFGGRHQSTNTLKIMIL